MSRRIRERAQTIKLVIRGIESSIPLQKSNNFHIFLTYCPNFLNIFFGFSMREHKNIKTTDISRIKHI